MLRLFIHYFKLISILGISAFFHDSSVSLIRDGKIYRPIINLIRIKEPITMLDDNEKYISLKVSSGLSIFKLVNYTTNNLHISGQEGMIGIPGTIGGAIITNASSYALMLHHQQW